MNRLHSVSNEYTSGWVLLDYLQVLSGRYKPDNSRESFKNILAQAFSPNNSVRYHDGNNLVESFEKTIAVVMFLFLAPLMLLISIAIKLSSSGPVFYSQRRVGKNGTVFKIYKFRTMVNCAEDKIGPVLSWKDDPRITRLGNFLRKTHFDEFPQLVNVMLGEMSFLGPRPERPELIERFIDDVDGYNHREVIKPGITGLAQVCCPYDATPSEKLDYDLFYIIHKNSISLNLLILFRTIKKVFIGLDFDGRSN